MNARSASIEPLEPRIAPAGVTVTGKIATWTDWDGDQVTMKWTGSNAPDFTHNHTPVVAVAGGIVLDEIILKNAADAITVSVKAVAGGDGRVDLGYMNATGLPLKSFSAPKASVLEIDCGDATNAMGTLTLGSFGTVAPDAYTAPGGDNTSTLDGNVGAVKIAGDFDYGAFLLGHDATTKVGSVFIGGNLNGDVATTTSLAANIAIESPVGSIIVAGNLIGGRSTTLVQGGIFGEEYQSITIGGDIIGNGVGGALRMLSSDRDSGKVTIGGSVIGGSHYASGFIILDSVKTLTIGGDLRGGTDGSSGFVFVSSSNATISVKGSVIGGPVINPTADSPCGAITVDGSSPTGGTCHISIGHNLIAGTVTNTGGNTTHVTYNGAVLVRGKTNLGSLSIGGNIEGTNQFRAFVLAKGVTPAGPGNFNGIGKLTVHGNVDYAVIGSGQDFSLSPGVSPTESGLGNAENPDAGIGAVTIGGNYWHTNLMAGVNDLGTLGVDSVDTQSMGDAARIAMLGPVVIKGAVLDDFDSFTFSGFEAEQIAKITVAGQTMFKHSDPQKYFDFSQSVFAREIAAM